MSTVYVKGLSELNRSLRKMEKGTRKELRTKLKEVGKIVATQAKANASARVQSHSGALVRKITPRLNARGMAVAATARHGGYNYPGRLEFDPSYEGRYAFLYPAINEKREEAVRKFEEVLEWMATTWKGV